MLKNIETKNRFIELIKNRIHLYYPELGAQDIQIRNSYPAKKFHKSMIYRFDVYKNDKFYKGLILKKRIFNPAYNNDILRDTKEEFDNLKSLNEIARSRFLVPRVLDMLPEEGILISEKVAGKSLHSYLREYSYLPLTKEKSKFLEKLFIGIGEWLREFHKATSTGQQEKLDTREYIKKARELLGELPYWGFSAGLDKDVIKRMEALESEVLNYTFPLTSKHGDFQAKNIIYDSNKIIVLDISSSRKDITIKDVASLISGSDTFHLKSLYSFLSKDFFTILKADFLKAYFQNKAVPYAAIEFLQYAQLLQSLRIAYRRNNNPIRRIWILTYYNKKIRELLSRGEK